MSCQVSCVNNYQYISISSVVQDNIPVPLNWYIIVSMYTVPIKLLKHFGVSSFSQYNSTKKICDYNIGQPRIIINMFIRITLFDNEYWKHWNKVEILLSVVESRNVLYLCSVFHFKFYFLEQWNQIEMYHYSNVLQMEVRSFVLENNRALVNFNMSA